MYMYIYNIEIDPRMERWQSIGEIKGKRWSNWKSFFFRVDGRRAGLSRWLERLSKREINV